ncbi:MAG: hypothetical protein CSA22_06285 [Deltaproteobacteria bacterium]|nr:MAG: hypothetical protein CSA22_06285 [Deltaproteobacteria bacterium]
MLWIWAAFINLTSFFNRDKYFWTFNGRNPVPYKGIPDGDSPMYSNIRMLWFDPKHGTACELWMPTCACPELRVVRSVRALTA